MDMAQDWRDEIRNPIAAALFALFLLAGVGMLAAMVAGLDLWAWRLFNLLSVIAIAYGVYRAAQVAYHKGGMSALWRDDEEN